MLVHRGVTLQHSSIRRYPFRHLGRVVRKPVNANPGLKINRIFFFFFGRGVQKFNVLHGLCCGSLRLLKLKLEGKTIKTESLTAKLQTSSHAYLYPVRLT